MDFKSFFIVALCVIISSVKSENFDGNESTELNVDNTDSDPMTTPVAILNQSLESNPTAIEPSSSANSSTESVTTSTTGEISTTTKFQVIVPNKMTTDIADPDAILPTQASNSNQSIVAAGTEVSTIQKSDPGVSSIVAPDAKDNSSSLSTPTTGAPTPTNESSTNSSTTIHTDAKNENKTGDLELGVPPECTKVGRFSHPSSCTKYYYCWKNSGAAYQFTCPEHRAFDPVTQHCVVNYGVCALAPKCENDKQVIPNPDDKWTFFQCKINRDESDAFELHCRPCADDREYDDKLGYCKLTSTNGEMVLDSDELTDEVACGETGLFIDYEDDTKYFECVVLSVSRGILKPVHRRCPIYHVFSMEERRCVPLSMLARLNNANETARN